MASARNLEVDLAAGNRAGLLADETGVTAIDSAGDVLDLAGSAEL